MMGQVLTKALSVIVPHFPSVSVPRLSREGQEPQFETKKEMWSFFVKDQKEQEQLFFFFCMEFILGILI